MNFQYVDLTDPELIKASQNLDIALNDYNKLLKVKQ
ncbi:aspartyl-phosphate phosphatase Spo0E family protein [Paenibacillus azoreducens]